MSLSLAQGRRQQFSRKPRGQKNKEKRKSAAGEKNRNIYDALWKRCKLT